MWRIADTVCGLRNSYKQKNHPVYLHSRQNEAAVAGSFINVILIISLRAGTSLSFWKRNTYPCRHAAFIF